MKFLVPSQMSIRFHVVIDDDMFVLLFDIVVVVGNNLSILRSESGENNWNIERMRKHNKNEETEREVRNRR